MQLFDDPGEAQYRIERYEANSIQISGETYQDNLVLMPDELIAPWNVANFAALDKAHVAEIVTYHPQLVIIGTGTKLITPKSYDFLSPLMAHNIGFEIMDTRAACRTYTILMAEGRKVLALMFLE